LTMGKSVGEMAVQNVVSYKPRSVCATMVHLVVTYKPLPVKHFRKHLALRTGLRKGKVRAEKVPETRRKPVRGRGCEREHAFSPGGPNSRIHTQRLRERNP